MPIVAEKLSHIYNKGLAYETAAVRDANFEIKDGEFVCIIGRTGSGKSTLAQHLNGLLKPTDGGVFVDGVPIAEKSASSVEMRKKIGMVFQYPEYQLFEETVYKDVAFGPINLGVAAEETEERVREALFLVGLDYEENKERSPFELSGGQKRKAAIAGVLAMRPEILILDEPAAGLDPASHDDLLALVESVREKTGATLVLISHNMEDVARLADRVLVMDAGEVVLDAPPQEVFADEEFLLARGLALPPARAFAARLAAKGLLGEAEAKGVLTRAQLTSVIAGLPRTASHARNDESVNSARNDEGKDA